MTTHFKTQRVITKSALISSPPFAFFPTISRFHTLHLCALFIQFRSIQSHCLSNAFAPRNICLLNNSNSAHIAMQMKRTFSIVAVSRFHLIFLVLKCLYNSSTARQKFCARINLLAEQRLVRTDGGNDNNNRRQSSSWHQQT